MKTFIRRHQFIIFILITFLFSWFPWYAGIAPEVMTMGPSIAAFLVVFILGGWRRLIDLIRPFGRWRVGLGYWGLAIFGPAVLYLIGLGIHLLMGGDIPPFLMIREELHLIPLYLVMVVLMPWNGPVGEEFGWRGYALPKLQSKYGPLFASLVIGAIWGIWHLPSFFAPQGVIGVVYGEVGAIFILLYTLGTIANSIFMTMIYNKSKASALVAGIIWHAAINFWAPVLLSDSSLAAAREGLQLPTIAANLYLAVLAVQVLTAVSLIVVTKGKLGYVSRTQPDSKDEMRDLVHISAEKLLRKG